jgi:uncharacterized protein (TIGR03437 family)
MELNTSAGTLDYFQSTVDGSLAQEAIVARLGSAVIDNYYWFPLHYSRNLPHWQLAGTTIKPTSVTGLGEINNSSADNGCNCHWGVEHIPPSELLLTGDVAYYPLSHEIAHQWVFYADYLDSAGQKSSDWRLNSFSCTGLPIHPGDTVQNTSMFPDLASQIVSRSVMGGPARDSKGQVVPYEMFGFSPLEMYLMGLATTKEVNPIAIYDSQGGIKTTISIDNVVAANGPRAPAYDGAAKTIRVPILVVVPQNEDIDDTTLNDFIGLIQSWKARFSRETGGRATIDSTIPAYPAFLSSALVSAASHQPGPLAADELVTLFGSNLSAEIASAGSGQPPTALAGATVTIVDSAGANWQVDLQWVGPEQISFVVPDDPTPGPATLLVSNAQGHVASAQINIASVSPGLFSANGDGKGVAAAEALKVRANGTQAAQPVFRCGPASGSCVSVPIDLGSDTDQVFLTLYGTGLRHSADTFTVQIGGLNVQPTYAGAQATYAGLDQINLVIPHQLNGSGSVPVIVAAGGQPANTVTINLK